MCDREVGTRGFVHSDTGNWVVAYRLRGEGLVSLIGVVVCLLAANLIPVKVIDFVWIFDSAVLLMIGGRRGP